MRGININYFYTSININQMTQYCHADEDLRDRASPDQAQPSTRMTQSMTLDQGLGQDPPLVSASESIIP